jgi:hypothetical protein
MHVFALMWYCSDGCTYSSSELISLHSTMKGAEDAREEERAQMDYKEDENNYFQIQRIEVEE